LPDKILLVEDDKDMCKMIAQTLKKKGYKIVKAYSGEEAVKKIISMNYDLAIVDFILPDMDGIEVIQKIRNIGLSISVIMISAYGNDLVKSKAKKLGVGQFLDKPFNLSKLLKVVNPGIAGQHQKIA